MAQQIKDTGGMPESIHIRDKVLRELISFDTIDTASFPVHVFPETIQQLIREAHHKLNFPPDYLGSSILFAASVAIGNTYHIEVKKGFITNTVVWIALVGSPGVNKSHPLKFAIRPILNRDILSYQQYASDCETYSQLENLSDKQRKELGYEYLPSKPVLKKHIVQDFTQEALANLHRNNLRGIGIYVDELIGWVNNFNRYNKGSDQESALQLWSGHPLSVDRKNSPSIFIPQPFVPVIGTIQPSVLTELGKNKGNGFLDRFLYAAPRHLKKEAWTDEEIDDSIETGYHEMIEHILQVLLEPSVTGSFNTFGEVLKLDANAKKLLYDWQSRNAEITNQTDSDVLKGYYNKMDIHVPRLILIMHLLKWAGGRTASGGGGQTVSGRMIDAQTAEAGIALGEYYRKQAEHVLEGMLSVSSVEQLPAKYRLFYEELPQTFKRKEILQMAEQAGIPNRTLDRMLCDRKLFIKTRNGEYEKLY